MLTPARTAASVHHLEAAVHDCICHSGAALPGMLTHRRLCTASVSVHHLLTPKHRHHHSWLGTIHVEGGWVGGGVHLTALNLWRLGQGWRQALPPSPGPSCLS